MPFSTLSLRKKIDADKLQLLIGDRNYTHTLLFYVESPNIIRVNRGSYILSDEYSHFLKRSRKLTKSPLIDIHKRGNIIFVG